MAEGGEGPHISDISDENFSISQNDILKKQIEKYITPSLDILFRNPSPYKFKWEQFKKAVLWLNNQINLTGAQQFRDEILYRFRTTQENDAPSVRVIKDEFEKQIINEDESEFYFTNLFQQGLIRAWAVLSDLMVDHGVKPYETAQALIAALEFVCFDKKKRFFGRDRDYLQNVILRGSRLKVNQSTKKQTLNLILGTMLSSKTKISFIESISVLHEGIDEKKIHVEIEKMAKDAIKNYLDQYLEDTRKFIEKEFRFIGFDEATVRELEKNERSFEETARTAFDAKIEELALQKLKQSRKILANQLEIMDKDLI